MSKIESGTVHFTVCPRGFTNTVRDFWASYEYQSAIACMEGLPEHVMEDVIFGRKMFIDHPESDTEEHRGEMMVVDEDEPYEYEQFLLYPPMEVAKEMGKVGANAIGIVEIAIAKVT